MASSLLTRSLYRSLMNAARRADGDAVLRQQLSKLPVDILQVAAAGLERRALFVSVRFGGVEDGVPMQSAGAERRLSRQHVVYDEAMAEGGVKAQADADADGKGVAVVSQHADYGVDQTGGEMFYDAVATPAVGPGGASGGVRVDFADGDHCTWEDESDVQGRVRQKKFVREERVAPGAKLLAVGGSYVHGSGVFQKWFRAVAVDLDEMAADGVRGGGDGPPLAGKVWTLASFCRQAFRHPRSLERLSFANSDSGAISKAFEVLSAFNVAASHVGRLGDSLDADALAAVGAREPVALPTHGGGAEGEAVAAASLELLAANGAFYASLQGRNVALMAELLDTEMICTHPFVSTLHGKDDVLQYFEFNFAAASHAFAIELEDVQVFLDSENVGRVVMTEKISSGDGDGDGESLGVAAVSAVNVFSRDAPGAAWRLRHRCGTQSPDTN